MAIFSILLTVLMIAGAVFAWRLSKRESLPKSSDETWRDDSLDDWRRQRDAEIELERQSRVLETKTTSRQHEGGAGNEEVETVRTQRIGG